MTFVGVEVTRLILFEKSETPYVVSYASPHFFKRKSL
jgi:hypothetical protein